MKKSLLALVFFCIFSSTFCLGMDNPYLPPTAREKQRSHSRPHFENDTLNLKQDRTKAIEAIQDALLQALNLSKARQMHIQGFQLLIDDQSPESKEFIDHIWEKQNQMLSAVHGEEDVYKRKMVIANLRHDDRTNIHLWQYAINHLTELLANVEQLEESNSLNWKIFLANLTGDAEEILKMAQVDARRSALFSRLNTMPELIHEYAQADLNAWGKLSRLLTQLSGRFNIKVPKGRSDQFVSLWSLNKEVLSLELNEENSQSGKKTKAAVAEGKKLRLIEVLKQHKSLIEAKPIRLMTAESRASSFDIPIQKPPRGREKKGTQRARTKRMTSTKPSRPSPEQGVITQKEPTDEEPADKAKEESVTLASNQPEERHQIQMNDRSEKVSFKDSLMYREQAERAKDLKAMKRQLAVAAFKAEQIRKDKGASARRSARMFEQIKLTTDEFNIYDRLMNRGGQVAPSWNEFVWLMKRIIKITSGKVQTRGGSAHIFQIGTRSFNVHKPEPETQAIPDPYIRGFIIPGFKYVGLTQDTVTN